MLAEPEITGIFIVGEHAKEKKSGGLGINKRNRGYPAVLNSSIAP